jgi:hypothetical protein
LSPRNRAVQLLESYFALDDERARRAIFLTAFDNLHPNPSREIAFSGPLAAFASDSVDKLLAFGRASRGKHALALLLETMAAARPGHPNPDLYDLPLLLNQQCALPTRAEECQYLERLQHEIETLARRYSPLSGTASSSAPTHKPTDDPWLDKDALELLLRHESRPRDEQHQPQSPQTYEDILRAFTHVKRAALLGAPGAGKSTTLRKLAFQLAQPALESPNQPLPLLVNLGNWLQDTPLTQYLADACPEIGWAAEALARQGRLVLLLDGLNEMPTAHRRAKAADVKALTAHLTRLNTQTAIFTTCRREDYTGDLDIGLDTLTLEPLTPQRIRAALRHWIAERNEPLALADRLFWQLAGDERLSQVLATWLNAGSNEDSFWSASAPIDDKLAFAKTSPLDDQLWLDHIPNSRSLLRLAANPFMLTMLFQVWRAEGDLPKNRGDLFARFTNRLLKREGLLEQNPQTNVWQPTAAGDALLSGLASLAWDMQTRRIADFEDPQKLLGVLTVSSRPVAVRLLGSEDTLKQALDATFLEGVADLRFRHQLLQEYFTALALQSKLADTPASNLWPRKRWWQRNGWEETAVLLAGFFPADCSHILRWLAEAQPEVAAQCILQSGAQILNRPALLAELQAAWLRRLTDIDLEPAPEARAAIGRALGRLDLDHRKGVGVQNGLPDIDWVEIAAGEFIYQGGERRQLDTFCMARYPITNSQWQAFLDAADGYANDAWWKGLTQPGRQPEAGRWTESNHPREGVSWYEAMAFCAWLGHKLNLPIQLPTEWQWERAARGVDGRTYPWGTDYQPGFANINETHYLARTSAVGIYPHGKSPEGVLDLAGNVWEWCLNEYSKPDRTQKAGTGSRVLRGGSWDLNQDVARAEFRYNYHPRARYNDFGFRVVVLSPIRNAGRP